MGRTAETASISFVEGQRDAFDARAIEHGFFYVKNGKRLPERSKYVRALFEADINLGLVPDLDADKQTVLRLPTAEDDRPLGAAGEHQAQTILRHMEAGKSAKTPKRGRHRA